MVLKKTVLLLLSIVLVISLSPVVSMAEPQVYIGPAQPKIPQNQTQANSIIKDLVSSPTNTIPSTTAGYYIDKYVNNQNAIRDSYLATARSYENAANNSQKAFSRMQNATEAASSASSKAVGANVAGKAFGIYCIGKDISEYTSPTANKHSSLAFIEQTLRGYSILSSAADTAGVKVAKPLALGSGILKDTIGGATFSNWANNQNNVALDFADFVTDGVNNQTTFLFSFYMDLFNNTDDADVFGRPPYGTGVYKPNIYLYPTKETKVTFTFDLPALLTTTIPKYQDQWQVEASPDGSLTDIASGIDYSYLFYESETDPALFSYNSGWVIKPETREAQFRQILSSYGFNQKEQADFIEFWSKKLSPDTDFIMYPQLTTAIDGAMPVNVSPQPDSIFRLWFAFEPYDGQTPELPEVRPITREGFTLVEWGGYILN